MCPRAKSLGFSVPWTMRPLELGQCVPWTICPLDDVPLDDMPLGRCVPRTMHPFWSSRTLDDAYLGRCVPCTMRLIRPFPDRCVLTLDRIEVLVVTSLRPLA
jgi:hypothetical protein